MHRCALFVDLGYVRAALRLVMGGASDAAPGQIDFPALAGGLEQFVKEDSEMPLLRSYWYDAATHKGEASALRRFGGQARVKIRLSPLSETGQKEVDIQLHDDLVALAGGGLVPTLYLLSGDGDFRPTVARAQALGVELVVVEILGSPASHLLSVEADRHVNLPADFFRPFLRGETKSQGWAIDTPSPGDPYEQAAFQAGSDFAREWMARVGTSTADQLVRRPNWRLPPELDADLLRSADSTTGLIREQPQLRRLVRAGFWRKLTAMLAPATDA